jgi:predicted PurR-regulated permease PerM
MSNQRGQSSKPSAGPKTSSGSGLDARSQSVPSVPLAVEGSVQSATKPRAGFFQGVPFPTIVATIGTIIITFLAYEFLARTTRVFTWVLVAAFFAVVLTPLVDFLTKKVGLRKGLAAGLVFLVGIGSLVLMGYVFIKPLAKQGTEFANNFPKYVTDAKAGKGEVGKLVKRWKVDTWLEENQKEIQDRAQKIFEPKKILGTTTSAIGSVFTVVAAILTIAVLSFLMLLEGRDILLNMSRIFPAHQRDRALKVGKDSARAVTGYVAGNLLISVIAGVSTFIFLTIAGVPFAGVLALWVGFADLIPLIGATLGAIPTVLVAFLASTTVGIATLIFYVIYQQFENHVLQVTIMSKTVALKPLIVLASVLFGVEIFGLLGALLAIPAAGIIKVVGADIIAHRRPDIAMAGHVTHSRVHLPKRWSKKD